MYKAQPCKICGQSMKLYDCEKCYGLCETESSKNPTEKENTNTKKIKINRKNKDQQ